MPAGNLDLLIEQGATFVKDLVWKAGTPSVGVDLTGCTGLLQVRARRSDEDVILELSTENDRITFGPALGAIHLEVTDEDTALLTKGGVYDLLITDSSGATIRLLEGALRVSPGATRREP